MATYPQDPVPSYRTTLGYDDSNVKDFRAGDGEPIKVVHGVLRKIYGLVYKAIYIDDKNTLINFYEQNRTSSFDWHDIETGGVKTAWFNDTPPNVTFVGPNRYDMIVQIVVEST